MSNKAVIRMIFIMFVAAIVTGLSVSGAILLVIS